MDEAHTDARIFLRKVMRHVLRTVYRSVLTAGAAEADHQTIEATLHISLHMRIHNTICMLQESEYLTVILKESDHRLITRSVSCTAHIVPDYESTCSRTHIRRRFLSDHTELPS